MKVGWPLLWPSKKWKGWLQFKGGRNWEIRRENPEEAVAATLLLRHMNTFLPAGRLTNCSSPEIALIVSEEFCWVPESLCWDWKSLSPFPPVSCTQQADFSNHVFSIPFLIYKSTRGHFYSLSMDQSVSGNEWSIWDFSFSCSFFSFMLNSLGLGGVCGGVLIPQLVNFYLLITMWNMFL